MSSSASTELYLSFEDFEGSEQVVGVEVTAARGEGKRATAGVPPIPREIWIGTSVEVAPQDRDVAASRSGGAGNTAGRGAEVEQVADEIDVTALGGADRTERQPVALSALRAETSASALRRSASTT